MMRLWYRSWGMESPPVMAAFTSNASTVAAAKPRAAECLQSGSTKPATLPSATMLCSTISQGGTASVPLVCRALA